MRLALHDRDVLPGGGGKFCSAALDQFNDHRHKLQEIDVDIGSTLHAGEAMLRQLSQRLGEAAVACRATLRSLRLSGPLHLGIIFQLMAPYAAEFRQLELVYLARGGDDWRPDVAALTLQQLPALRRLQFRFTLDEEEPPQDLPCLLLQPAAAAAGLTPCLQHLEHLALIFPVRSVIPPTTALPPQLSTMTQLTSLKVKRLPMVSTPDWLGELTQLRNLLWDPALPADEECIVPPGVGRLTQLECLWLVGQTPLELPTSLSNLQGLHFIGKGFREEHRERQRWDWMQPFARLRTLRMQGVGLQELPAEFMDKQQLTRLDLMVNQLQELPIGPYLQHLRHIHLGNNCLQHFPAALLAAAELESMYLANQSTGSGSGRSSPGGSMSSSNSGGPPRGGAGFTRRMELTEADVEGLLALPALQTVVMNNLQPIVHVGRHLHDFTWLQRLLKQRGTRLTSNELAYDLQPHWVFEVQPLLLPPSPPQPQQGGGVAAADAANRVADAANKVADAAL